MDVKCNYEIHPKHVVGDFDHHESGLGATTGGQQWRGLTYIETQAEVQECLCFFLFTSLTQYILIAVDILKEWSTLILRQWHLKDIFHSKIPFFKTTIV